MFTSALSSKAIDSLVFGLPEALRLTRKLLMLNVFCDDSGTDRVSTPFCALAGYVSEVERWKDSSDEWQDTLLTEPAIKYFKATEAESRRGEFWGWDPVARDQKLLTLASVIKKHVIGVSGL